MFQNINLEIEDQNIDDIINLKSFSKNNYIVGEKPPKKKTFKKPKPFKKKKIEEEKPFIIID